MRGLCCLTTFVNSCAADVGFADTQITQIGFLAARLVGQADPEVFVEALGVSFLTPYIRKRLS